MYKSVIVIFYFTYVSGCYWNSQCPYQLYGSKTPYDTVRGDIRDSETPPNCEAVSVWTINRHGNRNPGTSVTSGMRDVARIKDEIVASFDAGNSQLCAQDIENFRKWSWNSTLEVSSSFLTGTGYEELYDIGKRIREKFPHLLEGTAEEFYFRPTNEQRTITSCAAFVHGLTDGIHLNVTVEGARQRDDVARFLDTGGEPNISCVLYYVDFQQPYENCDRYQQEVRNGQILPYQLNAYFASPQYVAIQNSVQKRLGISTNLTADNIYSIYEICRFYRSWNPTLQSPWCAVFTEQDLVFLEYHDDVRHYYRNGYGSWVNENLGGLPMKDLYDNFEEFVQGNGRKVVSYFTHDTMIEMVLCALGLYREDPPLQASVMQPERVWRSSYIGAFSANVIAVLNRCNESWRQIYRVQLFFNERDTPICPVEGCTWEEFQNQFQPFSSANLDFCSMDYVHDVNAEASTNSASPVRGFLNW